MITSIDLTTMAQLAAQHSAHLLLTTVGLKITLDKGDCLAVRLVSYVELVETRFPVSHVASRIRQMEEELTS